MRPGILPFDTGVPWTRWWGSPHIHQMVVNDNHARDNTGLVLWADFIQPLVAIGLYAMREWALRHPGGSVAAEPIKAPEPAPPGG